MIYNYYALFEFDEEDPGYCVTFPDFGYIFTFGNNLEEALFNANEALELALLTGEDDNEVFPHESSYEELSKDLNKNQTLHLITVDTDAIR